VFPMILDLMQLESSFVSTGLDDQPRLNFAEFERQVIDDAGSVCLDIFPNGLLSFVVSDSLLKCLP
jgi:hypothetical protein